MTELNAGDRVHVFDPQLWGGRDQGDNSQFWMPATIIAVGRETVDVRFDHDSRISNGHFFTAVQEHLRPS